jgi:hypothetical protein
MDISQEVLASGRSGGRGNPICISKLGVSFQQGVVQVFQTIAQFATWCQQQGANPGASQTVKRGQVFRIFFTEKFREATIAEYEVGTKEVRLYKMMPRHDRELYCRSSTLARKLKGEIEVLVGKLSL